MQEKIEVTSSFRRPCYGRAKKFGAQAVCLASLLLVGLTPALAKKARAESAIDGEVKSEAEAGPAVSSGQLLSKNLKFLISESTNDWKLVDTAKNQLLWEQRAILVKYDKKPFVAAKLKSVALRHEHLELFLTVPGEPSDLTGDISFDSENNLVVSLQSEGPNAGAIEVQMVDHNEHYYGVWETLHGGNLDNRGARAFFQGTQKNTDVNFSSARAPFYMTSAGYGVYVQTTGFGEFAFAQKGITSFSFEKSTLKYTVMTGATYPEILARYNKLGGPTYLPPYWGFGVGWWRDDSHAAMHGEVKNAQENVLDDADHLERLHLPASYLWIDSPYGTGNGGWGNFDFDPSFPQPEKLIQTLAARGYNLMLWMANKAWEPTKLWKESVDGGYLFAQVDGSAVNVENFGAYELFKKHLEKYSDLGIKGYKIDRGEEDVDQVPNEFKNSEHIQFAKLVGESLNLKHPNDYFIFTRNLNDTGRRYASVWSGDPQCTFAGLRTTVAQGLRAAMMNFPMWGSDTGGYACEKPPKELLARWLAFSSVTPIMEILIGARRTPWYDYDDETVAIARQFTTLHHELMPYVRSQVYAATQTGMPVMRPLLFNGSKDSALVNLADEYLYGSELLVSPVVEQGATTRSVYFPPGQWLDYNNKSTVYKGGGRQKVAAPLSVLPIFVREGAIVPRGDLLKSNSSWTSNWKPYLRLEVYPSANVVNHFDYYDGSTIQRISLVPKEKQVQLTVPDLGLKGEIEIHCKGGKGATAILKGNTELTSGQDYVYDAKAGVYHIPLSGQMSLTIKGLQSSF